MTTLVALTDLPAGAALEFVVEALRRHGFQAASGSTPSFAGPVGEARVLSRGSEEIALSVSASDSGRGGAVVMHWGRAER
jgi:hypothetical protein